MDEQDEATESAMDLPAVIAAVAWAKVMVAERNGTERNGTEGSPCSLSGWRSVAQFWLKTSGLRSLTAWGTLIAWLPANLMLGP